MALIESYTHLKTEVGNWMARGDLAGDVPQFIQNWEENFYRDPHNFGLWMEAAFNSTIASGLIAVPADYLDLKYAYVSGNPSSRLERVSLNQLIGRYPRNSCTGIPRWMTREVGNFIFGPEPDSTYTIKGVYWAKPTPMRSFASDAAAHWIIVNAPDLALYGALLEATPFLQNDKRIGTWQSIYDSRLATYRRFQNCEPRSGTPIQEVLA